MKRHAEWLTCALSLVALVLFAFLPTAPAQTYRAPGVRGPSSSTDNAVCRWDLATGGVVQNSAVLITDADNVTIPGTLIVDGDTDAVQLTVQGNATQTTLPFVVEQSDGTDVFTVSNTGNVVLNGVNGTQSITKGTFGGAHLDFLNTGSLNIWAQNDNTGIGIVAGTMTFENQAAGAYVFEVNNVEVARLNTSALVLGAAVGVTVPDGAYLRSADFNAGAPPALDCDVDAELGRISIDTTNNRLYICNGATRAWDFIALTD